jgi:hypothetical protein
LSLDPNVGDYFVSGNIIPSATPNEFVVAFTPGQTTSSFVAALRKDNIPEGEEILTLTIQPSGSDYDVRARAGGTANTRDGKGSRKREHAGHLLVTGSICVRGAALTCILPAL